MLNNTLLQLYKLASESPAKEICGILTADLEIIPIKNVALIEHHFLMDRNQYFSVVNKLAKENRDILAIYHSHINNDPRPSKADIDSARRININYLIVTTNQYKWVDI